MPFPLNEPLSQHEIDKREKDLITTVGLSTHCIDELRRNTRSLHDANKIVRRMNNLKNLGFDVELLVECNTSILSRKKSTVERRFFMIQAWFLFFCPDANIHKLFTSRPQLWSVGHNKLLIIFLLSADIKKDVTPERICNMITLNLEDVLLSFIDGFNNDFMKLRLNVATESKKRKISQKAKKKSIMSHHEKLPPEVWMLYHEKYL